jgi:hypothetical protein
MHKYGIEGDSTSRSRHDNVKSTEPVSKHLHKHGELGTRFHLCL